MKYVEEICPIAKQATGTTSSGQGYDAGTPITGSQSYDLFALRLKERIRQPATHPHFPQQVDANARSMSSGLFALTINSRRPEVRAFSVRIFNAASERQG